MEKILLVLVAAGIVAVLFWPRRAFAIAVHRGKVRILGRIPASKRREIAEFFQRDWPTGTRLMIFGSQPPRGRLRLKCLGRLAPGDRQRIRNFLSLTLGHQ